MVAAPADIAVGPVVLADLAEVTAVLVGPAVLVDIAAAPVALAAPVGTVEAPVALAVTVGSAVTDPHRPLVGGAWAPVLTMAAAAVAVCCR